MHRLSHLREYRTVFWYDSSLGLELDKMLPVMLPIAGLCIGHETEQPVCINASDKYKPSVQLGELRLKGRSASAVYPDFEKSRLRDTVRCRDQQPQPANSVRLDLMPV